MGDGVRGVVEMWVCYWGVVVGKWDVRYCCVGWGVCWEGNGEEGEIVGREVYYRILGVGME